MNKLFEYRGELFPEYLKHGDASQFAIPFAQHFCVGNGLDVGAGKWKLPWAQGVDKAYGGDAMDLPGESWDFIFSSHCLEHLPNYVGALEHWRSKLRPDGVLFLYLPHPDMRYWRPETCRKHLHMFWPKDLVLVLQELGFHQIIHSERDLAWSFTVVARRYR